MEGARKYAKLFKTGQYGRLYITSGSHARGLTFRVQVLPKGEEANPNGNQNICLNPNAVEVYGIISGNSGWSEAYGWIHEGKWVEDFEGLVRLTELEIETENELKLESTKKKEMEEEERINSLLSNY